MLSEKDDIIIYHMRRGHLTHPISLLKINLVPPSRLTVLICE